MIKKYNIDVNVRESFEIVVNFDAGDLKIIYRCSTYSFEYPQTYILNHYTNQNREVNENDYLELKIAYKTIFDHYLQNNCISYSTYRAWQKFQRDLFRKLDILGDTLS